LPAPVIDPALSGGDGFCLMESMQTYSPTSARLLQVVQDRMRQYAHLAYPTTDIVQSDCNPNAAAILQTRNGANVISID
jgi:hypothetical protein